MKRQNCANIIVVALFAALLFLPLLFTDFAGGKISTTENRQLAAFPVCLNDETGAVEVSTSNVENWISDNVGFRQYFVKIYSGIKYKLFNQTSSSLVLQGTNGWYFFKGDNNIEIALGTYPLNEDDLKKIAIYQQQISDYYHSLGKEYILMLTPSKVSIYPEYLPMADEAVSFTPIDRVADYLTEHTDVIVYNSKDALLEAKRLGQLFYQTDTHWTDLGSYWTYRGLFDVMLLQGIVSGQPLEVSFADGELRGEFSAMMGNIELLPPESVPLAYWDISSYLVEEGEQYNAAVALQKEMNPAFDCAILKNASSNSGLTLQIYGDSELSIGRKFPYYLAENFSEVFNYAIRNVSKTVDAIGNPNVVIFSCSERYIQPLLTIPPDISSFLMNQTDISAIPVNDVTQHDGYWGMWVDYCNDELTGEQGVLSVAAGSDDSTVTLSGWAADFSAMLPLSALYVRVGDTLLQCNYGTQREDVATHFGVDAMLNIGFSVAIPSEMLSGETELTFIQITADGLWQYPPVVYMLTS